MIINMVTIMDPLSLHRRGNMLLYPKAAQYKSDWAKSVQSYLHGGANLKASFILPKFASYSEVGGLGRQTQKRIKQEKISEAALEKHYPQILSSVKMNKNGSRSIIWKRSGVRRPRVLFEGGHFVLRSDYGHSEEEEEEEEEGAEEILTARELLLLGAIVGQDARSTSEVLIEMINLGWDLEEGDAAQAGKILNDVAHRAQGSSFEVQNKRTQLGSFWYVRKSANA